MVDHIPIWLVLVTETPIRSIGHRLVHYVVTGNHSAAFVTPGKRLPQGHKAMLKVSLLPEKGVAGGIVAVPTGVLPASDGVQIEDRVQAVFFAPAQGLVQAGKTRL